MRIEECKKRLKEIQGLFDKVELVFDKLDEAELEKLSFVNSTVDGVIEFYKQAKAAGKPYVNSVKKPLNRAKLELERVLDEYERKNERKKRKQNAELIRLLNRQPRIYK